MERYSDDFCVLRFGDDLGFKSTTLLSSTDIKRLILPQCKKVVDLVHSYEKPFLLHSCGAIFDVMDESRGHGGFALGSGNSIPDYVPVPGYLAMVEACREYRGD